MVEIDKLPRITLHNLRPFLQNWAKLREVWGRLPEAKREEARSKYLEGSFTLQGISYRVKAEANPQSNQIEAFSFEWTNNGRRYSQRVALRWEASNIGGSVVAYFVCPYSGLKCRKLFFDGRVIASRRAFPHVYSYQNKSKRERRTDKLLKMMEYDPIRKYGKLYYRDKPTKYAQRVNKWLEERQDLRRLTEEAFLPKKMGRPKGSKNKIQTPRRAARTPRPEPPLFLK